MSNIHDEIIDILTPIIGFGLARTAVSTQCKKMGILPEELSEKNILEFSERFEKVLVIFAGDEVALTITHQIKSLK
ncbi:hypothetical protein Mhun_2041 [Methanospirillum hungatei JF-1]|jgi:hypothetical protein|uniref:Uncharacterized protein n=1 Tax=Methanospirillum hungatei JF-1 (strain ATCC 27890 / DSM 864 / NBRC 100397 / JF-1) TaxID=323259 RepID=Q2FQZ6_METHJ|nr:hypothetical protein [Methanospirillum hungatei]MBP9007967.1 hypothetical protein [Methanospirillum sp.]OQA58052.1 MAG: hypothetical protein BWY45_01325 [Euryarchaeota archaeon ADurb.Bin294]ABD41749.1 hypothetical protein Mhun_2041 [Methanospirillum hungatei JF-1]MCA1915162.1 hypothetical protein [Methanospirillum hungatei]HOW05101.1 hypothetical protein [Methanospirillum hungatei]